jgi:hypothetical protein
MRKNLLLLLLTTLSVSAFAQKGECLFGECDFGYGVMVYVNGEKYVGEFDNSKRHGQGVYSLSNGDKYVGTWKNNHQAGEGRLYKKDGAIEGGIWENGKLKLPQALGSKCIYGDCENNYGIFIFESGIKLAGNFKAGEPYRQVTVFYPNGAKYVGEFTNYERQGAGILSHPDGLIEEGFWANDTYSGSLKTGLGCVHGNCQDGNGKFIYDDYTTYIGDFENTYAHGYGECYFSDGDYYKGDWQDHVFHGKGTMFYSDGSKQEGIWKAGAFIGKVSAEPKRVVSAKGTFTAPKVYAVLVGVAHYAHMKSLKYTDDDAYRMFAFLKSPEGGALADEQIQILIDEDATKTNILKSLDKTFAKAGPNDVVLFYFSGHGLKGAFLPIDYDGNSNRLEHGEIMSILNKSEAKSKVVIADACHSGSLGGAKGSTAEAVIETYYNAFSKSSGGTVLMMSSKSEETSIENNGLRQGIFSHFMIRGLKGAADVDNDNLVTINELFQYTEANVKFYTNNYQTPVISGQFDKKMPMGVVRD